MRGAALSLGLAVFGIAAPTLGQPSSSVFDFADDFKAVCLAPSPNDNAVEQAAEKRGMKVVRIGAGEGDTVLLNSSDMVWSCLMSRKDPENKLPISALREALGPWPGGNPMSWRVERTNNGPDLWFTEGKADGAYVSLRTNRLRGYSVIYLQISQ